MGKVKFKQQFDAKQGECIQVSNSVRRITAWNSGPFTFTGTNTFLVGNKSVAVIDPGPADSSHIDKIIQAAGMNSISHIFVTHTHMDHSPGARLLQQQTGAPIVGAGPHVAYRKLRSGEQNPLDSSSDTKHHPDQQLADNESISGGEWTIETVTTPGHTENHLSFALEEEAILFSGDHVMAWSTTIVAPPDGSMGSYMESLRKLQSRRDRVYLPAHGGPVENPKEFVESLIAHRIDRERALICELEKGPCDIPSMVQKIYRETPVHLHGAAALSMLAHLEHLIERKMVAVANGSPLKAEYRLL